MKIYKLLSCIHAHHLYPVSYTHLDVYKRQGLYKQRTYDKISYDILYDIDCKRTRQNALKANRVSK